MKGEVKMKHGRPLKDLGIRPGQKFGMLTVIGPVDECKQLGTNSKWICQCDCGKYKHIRAYNLTHNHTRSCGCQRGKLPGVISHSNIYVRKRSRTAAHEYTVAASNHHGEYIFATTDHDTAKMVRDIANEHFANGTFDEWLREIRKYKGDERLQKICAVM